jgi:hypothetical protein
MNAWLILEYNYDIIINARVLVMKIIACKLKDKEFRYIDGRVPI